MLKIDQSDDELWVLSSHYLSPFKKDWQLKGRKKDLFIEFSINSNINKDLGSKVEWNKLFPGVNFQNNWNR